MKKFGAGTNLVGSKKKSDKTGASGPGNNTFPKDHRTLKELNWYECKLNLLDQAGMSQLHWAVRKRDIETVKNYIKSGANVNVLDKDGISPARWAAALQEYQILFLLLDAGAELTSEIEPILSNLTNERKTYYGNNKKSLENEVKKSSKEKQIILSFHYGFTSLPESIISLENLTELSLTYNNLLNIPKELFKMDQIIKLDVSNNLINEIPQEISSLTSLKSFNISNNFLQTFPELSGTEYWTNLNISGNQLQSLPLSISKYYRLIQFDCSNNLLTEIPKTIVEILGVEYLNFSHNKIAMLRDVPIHLLLSLVTLDLSYNQLTMVPFSEIMNSQTIRNFHFKQNRIPTDIYRILKCFYSKHEHLDLSGLNLITLIPEFKLLTHLKDLNLSNNSFITLPNEIGSLTDLTNLDLSFNKFTDLPLFIHRLSNLQNLNLDETKSHIENPPKSVIDRGLKTIMGHYFDLLQGDPCYRLKLMIVGQGLSSFPLFISSPPLSSPPSPSSFSSFIFPVLPLLSFPLSSPFPLSYFFFICHCSTVDQLPAAPLFN